MKNRFHALQRLFTRNDPRNFALVQESSSLTNSPVFSKKRKIPDTPDTSEIKKVTRTLCKEIQQENPITLFSNSTIVPSTQQYPILYPTFLTQNQDQSTNQFINNSTFFGVNNLLSSEHLLTPIDNIISPEFLEQQQINFSNNNGKFPKLDFLAALSSQLSTEL